MSEASCSVQHLEVTFCPRVVSNVRTSSVVVQGSTSTTMSTEELKLIQIRHQDISTKNKTVTLLANILQRLTEQHVVLWRNVTKLQNCFFFYCKGWCLKRRFHSAMSQKVTFQLTLNAPESRNKVSWHLILQCSSVSSSSHVSCGSHVPLILVKWALFPKMQITCSVNTEWEKCVLERVQLWNSECGR